MKCCIKKSSVSITGVMSNRTGFSPEEPAVVACVLSKQVDYRISRGPFHHYGFAMTMQMP